MYNIKICFYIYICIKYKITFIWSIIALLLLLIYIVCDREEKLMRKNARETPMIILIKDSIKM